MVKLIFDDWSWKCENCKSMIALPGIVPSLETLKERGWKYCPVCGKKIDFKSSEADKFRVDIRDIDGMWCDDITFCSERCGWKSCPRNQKNIRDRTIPHSFLVEIPQDCPKRKECR